MTGQDFWTGPAFWQLPEPLVLASGSTARRRLLEACAIPLRIVKPQVEETTIAAALLREGTKPRTIAAALAEAKGCAVSAAQPDALVLAADQTLDHAGVLFMKPVDHAAARSQLQRLRGGSHQLYSAATLWRGNTCLWQGVSSARLTMRVFSDAFIDTYLAQIGAAALDTVGCYQIEALGPHLFDEIEGEHATILGLPLLGVLKALRDHGALLA